MNDTVATSKTCSRCGLTKAFTAFYAQKSGKYGYTATCRSCQSEIAREYNARPDVKERRRKVQDTPGWRTMQRTWAAKPSSKAKARARRATPEFQEHRRLLRENNRLQHRISMWRWKYKTTGEWCLQTLEAQEYKCANSGCGVSFDSGGRKTAPHLDHCHTTGAARRFLCSLCNTAYGQLRESPGVIRGILSLAEADQATAARRVAA